MRRTLASYLSRIACWLRGDKWYVADNWHGVPGNRAAELKQRIWQECVLLKNTTQFLGLEGNKRLDSVERDLDELAQLAGENWGHVWPKEERKNERDTKQNCQGANRAPVKCEPS